MSVFNIQWQIIVIDYVVTNEHNDLGLSIFTNIRLYVEALKTEYIIANVYIIVLKEDCSQVDTGNYSEI